MAGGDLLDQGQAEADAAGLLGMAGQAEERLEDALAHRFGNARAAIADLEPDEVAPAHRDVAEADLDLAAAVALRVLEQIAYQSAQQARIAMNDDRLAGDVRTGARGFWSMSTLGLVVAATSLTAVLAWRLRQD